MRNLTVGQSGGVTVTAQCKKDAGRVRGRHDNVIDR